jgi:hypothetical protein
MEYYSSVMPWFAGSIPKENLQLMSEAIKQDCEKVDFDEW